MHKLFLKQVCLSVSGLILFSSILEAQLPYKLIDGTSSEFCTACQDVANEKPQEVLFGIDIHEDGDVFFSMTNRKWFDKLISLSTNGISADIVSKERYSCDKEIKDDFLRGDLNLSAAGIILKRP